MGRGYGKKFDHCGDSEATDYNHKAVKSAAARTNGVDKRATDYSIEGKKRGSYKQDGE